MFLVFDKVKNQPDFDQYGHVKVYSTKAAAKRRAGSGNNACCPKLDRFAVAPVTLRLEYDQGRPVIESIK